MQALGAFILALLVHTVSCEITVSQFEVCDKDMDYPMNVWATFKRNGDKEYVNASLKSSIPIGDNLMAHFIIYTSLDGKKYTKIFTLREKVCRGLKNYVGDFAFNIERKMGVTPGVCPIPPGRYFLRNYALDFNTFKLKTFPVGYLKFDGLITDIRTNKSVCCLKIAAILK